MSNWLTDPFTWVGIGLLVLFGGAALLGHIASLNAVLCPKCEHYSTAHSNGGWNCCVTVQKKVDGYIRERRCSCELSEREVKLNILAVPRKDEKGNNI